MRDVDCSTFLRWCLPQLDLEWQGYRKVRGTVCKRIHRRRRQLGLPNLPSYRAHLAAHPEEWPVLDDLCRIPISRFWRDPEVFACLATEVLPHLAALARHRRDPVVRCWSAGCASGEEPYGLRLAWAQHAEGAFADVGIAIVASDADETMLARARAGIYRSSSLRDLPADLRTRAFEITDDGHGIRSRLRDGIAFLRQDVRFAAPRGAFDLILCRNLAFTYFAQALRRDVLARLADALRERGYLVIGARERLPAYHGELEPAFDALPIYRRVGPTSRWETTLRGSTDHER